MSGECAQVVWPASLGTKRYMWMRTRLVDALGSPCTEGSPSIAWRRSRTTRGAVQNIRRLKLAVNGWEVADAHGAIATTGSWLSRFSAACIEGCSASGSGRTSSARLSFLNSYRRRDLANTTAISQGILHVRTMRLCGAAATSRPAAAARSSVPIDLSYVSSPAKRPQSAVKVRRRLLYNSKESQRNLCSDRRGSHQMN
jgi:hypothetical protein